MTRSAKARILLYAFLFGPVFMVAPGFIRDTPFMAVPFGVVLLLFVLLVLREVRKKEPRKE